MKAAEKKSPRNPPCGPRKVVLRGTFSLLRQVFLSLKGSHPLVYTAREENRRRIQVTLVGKGDVNKLTDQYSFCFLLL